MNFVNLALFGKSHQQPFIASQTLYPKPLQLVFIDIWGLTSTLVIACYYIAFVDAYTRYVWFYLIQSKITISNCFQILQVIREKPNWFSTSKHSNR